MRQMNIAIQVGAMTVVNPYHRHGSHVVNLRQLRLENTCKGLFAQDLKKTLPSIKGIAFEQPTSLACAEAYLCTDIPTSARNEMGKTCTDFNSDPNFRSGIFSGVHTTCE